MNKISIDGRFLHKPFSGINQFLVDILKHLNNISDIQITVITPYKLKKEFLTKHPNLEFISLKNKSYNMTGMDVFFYEQVLLPKKVKELGIKKLFSPSPLALIWNIHGLEVFPTIHDAIPWVYAEYYQESFLSKVKHRMIKKHIENSSKKIFTVSKFSKEEINKYLNIPKKKILVLGNIYPEMLETKQFKCKKKYKDINYVLYLGGYDTRKNTRKLSMVADMFKKDNIRLICIGKALYKNSLYKDYYYLKKNKNIIFTGFIKQDEVYGLFQNASGFISPTEYEGFNIPAMYAIAAGIPTYVSDIPIHRELFLKSGAISLDTDHRKWAACIKKAKTVKNRRQNLKNMVSSNLVIEKLIKTLL